MRLKFRLVNVFALDGDRLTGNPLCVIEDATGLTDAQMQALALQFNLSETSFILPSGQADARVRIFTPGYEMPFAGHPTLGTAEVLRSLTGDRDALTLELNVGPVGVRADGDLWELEAREPETRPPRASGAELASALGLDVADLAQAYVFAQEGPDSVVARFFFTKGSSLLEDPATGSAAANLGGWYLAQITALPLERTISQGRETGRPSRLRLRVDEDGAIFVAGEVVPLGRGYVEV
jgi:trans-2,3-dihydro-3-hydroxyanthranilate isomerase